MLICLYSMLPFDYEYSIKEASSLLHRRFPIMVRFNIAFILKILKTNHYPLSVCRQANDFLLSHISHPRHFLPPGTTSGFGLLFAPKQA